MIKQLLKKKRILILIGFLVISYFAINPQFIDSGVETNIKKGLELQGGTRVLLQPEVEISDQERDDLISVMDNRLNTYGLSDIEIRKADDLSGNKFVLVEIAGATEQEVADLIASQGKFEARIGNETIFTGGREDIPFVCRNDGTCSGITQCSSDISGLNFCTFDFAITISQRAAEKHAEVTSELDIITTDSGTEALSKQIDFYLDGNLTDSLNIDPSLKGVRTTQISITGSGTGFTEDEALENAQLEMNKLQTLLLTGSFPFKLDIVKLDSVSPSLGSEFTKNAFQVGLLAILAVAIVVFIRYRNFKIVIPMIIASLSEVFIILGLATTAKYTFDIAAIAGIIAAVGTGVDDQIIIIDETLSKNQAFFSSWKQRLKRAFFIIMVAFFTTLAAMLPLIRAGAGLIRGFAIITILGITIGVLITRPAFAAIIESLTNKE